MKRISINDWANYKNTISEFLEKDAGLKPITWLKNLSQPLPNGEDVGLSFFSKELMVLVGYNVFRTWPVNSVTPSGEIDNETCYILISKRYLQENNHLDDSGNFNFDITRDRFIIDNVIYKSSGDTAGAQASDSELVVMIILKRLKVESIGNYKIIS